MIHAFRMQVTPDLAPLPLRQQIGRLFTANVTQKAMATRVEGASIRRVQGRRNLALHDDLVALDTWIRRQGRRQQGLGIGMQEGEEVILTGAK